MWSNVALVVIACVIVACIYIFAQPAKSKFREQFAINVEQDYRQSINKTFNKVLGRDPQEYEVQLYRDSMTSPFDTEPIEKKLQASAEFKTVVEANTFAQTSAQPFPTYPIPNPVPKPRLVDASAPFTNADEALITKATMAAATAAATVATTNPSAANPSANSDPKSNNDQTIASMDLGKRLELYRLIVSIYEKNLERLPSMKELNYYTVRITNDKTFNSDKLIKILQSSQEYNILQKNQTNVVNAELEGAITDAQLTLLVNDIYSSMFKNEEPSKSFEDFMKVKYVEYKLDDVKFRKMLAMLHDVDVDADADAVAVPPAAVCPVVIPASASNAVNAVNTQTQASTANTSTNANANANASIALIPTLNGGKMSASSTQVGSANSISTPGTQQVLSNQTQSLNAANAANAANNVIQEAAYPSKALADSYCTTAAAYNKNKVFDSLYANIQLAQQQTCTIVAPNSSTYGDRNKLAETMDDRNQSRLGYECARNSESILSAQDNARFQYSYDPNVVPLLRNTKFGTFLDDAENTSVGSIMPRFVYREYGTVL